MLNMTVVGCVRKAAHVGVCAVENTVWVECLSKQSHLRAIVTNFCYEDVIYKSFVIQLKVASSMTIMVEGAVCVVMLIDQMRAYLDRQLFSNFLRGDEL